MITQENARFLATQAHRIYVTVHEAFGLNAPESETVACSLLMNAQKYRTPQLPHTEGFVKFKQDFTFGTNTLANVSLLLRITQGTDQHEIGRTAIPLEQLLVSNTWDNVFPVTDPHSAMSGSIHLTLDYVPNESLIQTKLSKTQIDAFCRSQPCRLLISVLQVESLPTPSAELCDIYYRVAFNRQFQKSSVRRASNCPNWHGERLAIGVANQLPTEPLRFLFQMKLRKSRCLAALECPLDCLPPNHELVGWFPLLDPQTDSPLPAGRALVSVEYHLEGAWSTETLGRLFFRPAPPFYLSISVLYPRQKMRVGETMRVQVKVRDLQHNNCLTDNLQGGELELHVQLPNGGRLFLLPNKNYPNPEVGLFYIDLSPQEPGLYVSMLKYNDQEMQHRNCQIKVRPARGAPKISISIDQ
jgi:hypothetical protein